MDSYMMAKMENLNMTMDSLNSNSPISLSGDSDEAGCAMPRVQLKDSVGTPSFTILKSTTDSECFSASLKNDGSEESDNWPRFMSLQHQPAAYAPGDNVQNSYDAPVNILKCPPEARCYIATLKSDGPEEAANGSRFVSLPQRQTAYAAGDIVRMPCEAPVKILNRPPSAYCASVTTESRGTEGVANGPRCMSVPQRQAVYATEGNVWKPHEATVKILKRPSGACCSSVTPKRDDTEESACGSSLTSLQPRQTDYAMEDGVRKGYEAPVKILKRPPDSRCFSMTQKSNRTEESANGLRSMSSQPRHTAYSGEDNVQTAYEASVKILNRPMGAYGPSVVLASDDTEESANGLGFMSLQEKKTADVMEDRTWKPYQALVKILNRPSGAYGSHVTSEGDGIEESRRGPPFMSLQQPYTVHSVEDSVRKPCEAPVKILNRPQGSCSSSVAPKSDCTEESANGRLSKSLQQREKDYMAARLRILGSAHGKGDHRAKRSGRKK